MEVDTNVLCYLKLLKIELKKLLEDIYNQNYIILLDIVETWLSKQPRNLALNLYIFKEYDIIFSTSSNNNYNMYTNGQIKMPVKIISLDDAIYFDNFSIILKESYNGLSASVSITSSTSRAYSISSVLNNINITSNSSFSIDSHGNYIIFIPDSNKIDIYWPNQTFRATYIIPNSEGIIKWATASDIYSFYTLYTDNNSIVSHYVNLVEINDDNSFEIKAANVCDGNPKIAQVFETTLFIEVTNNILAYNKDLQLIETYNKPVDNIRQFAFNTNNYDVYYSNQGEKTYHLTNTQNFDAINKNFNINNKISNTRGNCYNNNYFINDGFTIYEYYFDNNNLYYLRSIVAVTDNEEQLGHLYSKGNTIYINDPSRKRITTIIFL